MIEMIIAGDSVVNRYYFVCGYVHKSKEDYRICDYCLQHKCWISLPKPVIYRYEYMPTILDKFAMGVSANRMLWKDRKLIMITQRN